MRARRSSRSRISCCWISRRRACASRSWMRRTGRCSISAAAELKDYTALILRELAPYLDWCPIASASPGIPIPPRMWPRPDTRTGISPRSCQRGAARAAERRAARRQGRARGRPVLRGAVRQEHPRQPDQPPHQHHRDDQAGRRGCAQDRLRPGERAQRCERCAERAGRAGRASAAASAPAAAGAAPAVTPAIPAAPATAH